MSRWRRPRCEACGKKGHTFQTCPLLSTSGLDFTPEQHKRLKDAIMRDPEFQEEMAVRRARKTLGTPKKRRRWGRGRHS